MNSSKIDSINRERLFAWRGRLNESHATPVVLLGVGHDHNNGQIVVCVTHDMTDKAIILFLKKALKEMEAL